MTADLRKERVVNLWFRRGPGIALGSRNTWKGATQMSDGATQWFFGSRTAVWRIFIAVCRSHTAVQINPTPVRMSERSA